MMYPYKVGKLYEVVKTRPQLSRNPTEVGDVWLFLGFGVSESYFEFLIPDGTTAEIHVRSPIGVNEHIHGTPFFKEVNNND